MIPSAIGAAPILSSTNLRRGGTGPKAPACRGSRRDSWHRLRRLMTNSGRRAQLQPCHRSPWKLRFPFVIPPVPACRGTEANLSRRAVEDLQFRGPFIPDRMKSLIIGKCRIFTWAVASASRLHCGTRAALGGAGRRASSASYRALSAPIRGLPRCVPQTPA
jgi:hypothetical protein